MGALEAVHEPAPEVSEDTVHKVVVPVLKLTEPVGVPPDEVTVAE